MIKQFIKKIIPDFVLKQREVLRFYKKDNELKKFVTRNKSLKNKYEGERCFIFGNGPSINKLNFSLFSNEYTFTVNQLSKHPDFYKLNTNFHVWQDERFFLYENIKSLEFLSVLENVQTENNKPLLFYRGTLRKLLESNNINKELKKYYFLPIKPRKYYFYKLIDYSKPVQDYPTVVQTCITLAVFMGFKEIYLLGCDCTGIISIVNSRLQAAESSLYSYNINEFEKKRLEKMTTFSTFRDEMASQVEIIDLYGKLLKYCKKHKVKLFNATKGGLLESLPRINLKEVLDNER